jgi:hypothetical protein
LLSLYICNDSCGSGELKEPINNDASSGSNDASNSTSPNPNNSSSSTNEGSSSTNDGTNPNVKTSAPKHDDHGIIDHFIWGGGSSNGGDSFILAKPKTS